MFADQFVVHDSGVWFVVGVLLCIAIAVWIIRALR